jgi:hypothetical protein
MSIDAPRNPNAWRPVQWQLIAFPAVAPLATEQHWWQAVTGQEIGESIRRPHERTDVGALADCILSLAIEPAKVTWTMTPSPDPVNLPPLPIPTFASYSESRDLCLRLLRPWLVNDCPAIKRLGLVASLIQDATDHAEAYRLLDLYLPAVEVDPESTDFAYRVNRRRRSQTPISGLHVNRMTAWSAMRFSSSLNTIGPGSTIEIPLEHSGAIIYAAMVTIDVNSDAGRSEDLLRDERGELLAEFADLTTEIAVSGDIR